MSNRGDPETQPEANRMVRDPRRLGHSISRCRRCRFGATRILIVGDTGSAKNRGNSELSQPAPPKDARIEATRRSIAGKAGDAGQGETQVLHRGRCRRAREPPGKLGTSLKPAPPKACEVRGNSNGRRRHSRRTETKGRPEDSDAGSAERERGTGQLGAATRAEREDAGSGATRSLHQQADQDDA